MIPVILTILKVIGFLLLGLLGLVLLLLLIVLLVPVGYRGRGTFFREKTEESGKSPKPKGSVLVSWFLQLIALDICYEDGLSWELRIFGRRIKGSKPRKKRRPKQEDTAAEASVEEPQSLPEEEGKEQEAAVYQEPEKVPEEASEENLPESEETPAVLPAETGEQKPVKVPLSERIEALWEKIWNLPDVLDEKIEDISEKISELYGRYEEISGILTDEENHRLLGLCLRQLKKLLLHIWPRRADGRFRFGFDDPAVTGNILAGLAMIRPVTRGHLDVTPEFDREVIDADGSFSGRVRLGTVLVIVLRLFFNKKFRYWFKKIVLGG